MAEKRVLIVDDEPQIREMYAQFFSQSEYTVETAESAEDALDLIRKKPFWVIFLDLNLPGMNGIDLCRLIRKDYPMAIPIAVTGCASLFELTDCRDAGFEDYFIKPVSLPELLKVASSAFEKLERWKRR